MSSFFAAVLPEAVDSWTAATPKASRHRAAHCCAERRRLSMATEQSAVVRICVRQRKRAPGTHLELAEHLERRHTEIAHGRVHQATLTCEQSRRQRHFPVVPRKDLVVQPTQLVHRLNERHREHVRPMRIELYGSGRDAALLVVVDLG